MRAFFIDTPFGFVDYNDRTGLVDSAGFGVWLAERDDVVEIAYGTSFRVNRDSAQSLFAAAQVWARDTFDDQPVVTRAIGFEPFDVDSLVQVPDDVVV